MAFWDHFKRRQLTPDEKAARATMKAQRDQQTYDAIMSSFVQPLPTFNTWVQPSGPRSPPSYENIVGQNYQPATYYPNQSYENPYGQYPYSACPSDRGSIASTEVLPTYVQSTYNPVVRQMFKWQLPPFLLFGVYWTFIHPFFRSRTKTCDYEEEEDPMVTRVKRKIEVKWGLRCLFAFLIWTACIVTIVVLLVKSENAGSKTFSKRWVEARLRETGKPIFI